MAGLGNPIHADDAVGVVVAEKVYRILRHELPLDLLEWPILDARLAERLIGFQHAAIVDALIDTETEIGTVKRLTIATQPVSPALTLHTAGFQNILALARRVGAAVPRQMRLYGIVIRPPRCYVQGLSGELGGKIPGIVTDLAAQELRIARRFGSRQSFRPLQPETSEEPSEAIKRPP